MHPALYGRSFVKELDFTPAQWRDLLDLAAELKAAKKSGNEAQHLVRKNIAIIFEKTSTRTRCAFEVAAYDQGAHITYLDPSGSQMGHKESTSDTAKVLGRYYDAIEYRGSSQATVETLAADSGVPVWNGLTDDWHPTQMLADHLTMREHAGKPDEEIVLAYVGDARNNVGNSLLISCAMLGIDVRMVAPKELQNLPEVVGAAQKIAAATGAKITITDDIAAGVKDCDFIYTDVWLSMGESKDKWHQRITLLKDFQVNAELMAKTGKSSTLFLHCLPAFHDTNTTVGEEIFDKTGMSALEVSDEVFNSPASIVFDQAENRLHTIKAVMVATLGR